MYLHTCLVAHSELSASTSLLARNAVRHQYISLPVRSTSSSEQRQCAQVWSAAVVPQHHFADTKLNVA